MRRSVPRDGARRRWPSVAPFLSQLRQRGALAVEVPSAELTSAIVNRYLGVKERNLV